VYKVLRNVDMVFAVAVLQHIPKNERATVANKLVRLVCSGGCLFLYLQGPTSLGLLQRHWKMERGEELRAIIEVKKAKRTGRCGNRISMQEGGVLIGNLQLLLACSSDTGR
jgi:hypothetical protein